MHFFHLFFAAAVSMHMYTILYTTDDRHAKSDLFFLLFLWFSYTFPGRLPAASCALHLHLQPSVLLVCDHCQVHILPTHRTYLLHTRTKYITYCIQKKNRRTRRRRPILPRNASYIVKRRGGLRRRRWNVLIKVRVCTASTYGLQVATHIIITRFNNVHDGRPFLEKIMSLHESCKTHGNYKSIFLQHKCGRENTIIYNINIRDKTVCGEYRYMRVDKKKL